MMLPPAVAVFRPAPGDEGGKLAAAIWFRHKKSARRSERPSQSCTRWTLHLRITLLGRVIPHAAFFVATSLVRRLRHVSSKGWASHGQGQRHGNHRDNSFHECSPYQTLSATGLPGNASDLEI